MVTFEYINKDCLNSELHKVLSSVPNDNLVNRKYQ